MTPIDIDPATGAPVIKPVTEKVDSAETSNQSAGTANSPSEFVVPSDASGVTNSIVNDSETVSDEAGTNQSKSEDGNETATIKDSIDEIDPTLVPLEVQNVGQEKEVKPKDYRKREAQYRAIERILRTGGMDSQQAEKAFVEIRRVLNS